MFRLKNTYICYIVSILLITMFGCSIFDDDDRPKPKPYEPPKAPESVSTYSLSGRIIDEDDNPIQNGKFHQKFFWILIRLMSHHEDKHRFSSM